MGAVDDCCSRLVRQHARDLDVCCSSWRYVDRDFLSDFGAGPLLLEIRLRVWSIAVSITIFWLWACHVCLFFCIPHIQEPLVIQVLVFWYFWISRCYSLRPSGVVLEIHILSCPICCAVVKSYPVIPVTSSVSPLNQIKPECFALSDSSDVQGTFLRHRILRTACWIAAIEPVAFSSKAPGRSRGPWMGEAEDAPKPPIPYH